MAAAENQRPGTIESFERRERVRWNGSHEQREPRQQYEEQREKRSADRCEAAEPRIPAGQ